VIVSVDYLYYIYHDIYSVPQGIYNEEVLKWHLCNVASVSGVT